MKEIALGMITSIFLVSGSIQAGELLPTGSNTGHIEIKGVDVQTMNASRIGLVARQLHRCGTGDRLYCRIFIWGETVYFTTLHFGNNERMILQLTRDEYDEVSGFVHKHARPAMDVSGCHRQGIPLSMTCQYYQLKFVSANS